MIFRIFQEALTNIRKHTQANRVVIDLDQKNGSAVFSIKDNGKGFNLKAVKGKKSLDGGLGLTAITERAIMAGGTLELTSEVGQGTTIVFSIPLKQTKKKQSLYLLLPSVKVKG
jgi:signal transduction histidine kinase